MRHVSRLLLIAGLVSAGLFTTAQAADEPYTQVKDIVFAETDGIGLLLDVFTPKGPSNGLAIVDVASGAFYSDRGKIEDHRRAQMFDIFCGRGYTVFAVRPGSITKFSLAEMAKNVKTGIRWVKDHAAEYKIDPDRIGLDRRFGRRAPGLARAVTADDKCRVAAVGAFFPPTNFLEYRGAKIDENTPPAQLAFVSRFVYPGGGAPKSTSELIEKLKAVSPALCCTDKAPPFLLIHGDADPLVPLDQSQKLQAALQECKVPCELIVKEGGGHPWPTIHEEVKVIADWLDKQLVKK